ncbi:MAG: hypothetical protein ABIS03_01075 [Gemmatimonadaceae bacterium]
MTEDNRDETLLRDLEQRVAQLPREISPPAGAWDAIRSAIETAPPDVADIGQYRVRVWQRPAFLAAAAAILIATSSLVTMSVVSDRPARQPNRPVAMTVQPSTPSGREPATLAEFTGVEKEYITTVQRLTEALDRGDTELKPETIAKLKESLRVIDGAIVEARRALEADPANGTLVQMLASSYSQKVDLLRRVGEMGRS